MNINNKAMSNTITNTKDMINTLKTNNPKDLVMTKEQTEQAIKAVGNQIGKQMMNQLSNKGFY